MMITKPFIIFVSLLLSIGSVYSTPYQPVPDTTEVDETLALATNNNLPVNDTASLNLLIANELKRSVIGDILDSLVNIKFFTNTTFPADTTALNTNYYPAGFIPVFSDSVFEARIKELNNNSAIELT